MNRTSLEAISTSMAVFILAALVFLTIGGLFIEVLDLHLLSNSVEQMTLLAMSCLAILLGACVLVSLMLNISIIANKIREIADCGAGDEY